jgi:hypothetical protein
LKPKPIGHRPSAMAIAAWLLDAGLGGIEGLDHALTCIAPTLTDLASLEDDAISAAVAPLGMKGVALKKMQAAIGMLRGEVGAAFGSARRPSAERSLLAPLDLGTSVTSEAAALSTMPPRFPLVHPARLPAPSERANRRNSAPAIASTFADSITEAAEYACIDRTPLVRPLCARAPC